jgi:hypothetical protein
LFNQQGEKATMEQGKIQDGFYIQGDLKFAVDAADAHKTFDAVGALSNVDKVKLAKLNGIVAEPYNRNLLTAVLKSVVQNVWFANKLGTIPVEVLAGHNARVAKYTAEISVPTSGVDFLSRKPKATSTAKPSLQFVIDPAKYEEAYTKDHDSYRGQRYLVIKSMIELNAVGTSGKSIREIFENCKETRETSGPTRNAVGQIVNALVGAGIATCLNPQDAKAKPTPKAKTPATPPAPPAPPAAPKHNPPAATGKKKH